MKRIMFLAATLSLAAWLFHSCMLREPDRGGREITPPTPLAQLLEGIREGDIARVGTLLQGQPSLATQADSATGFTPLHVAVDSFQLDAARLLVERGADVNATTRQGLTPLHCAAQQDAWRIARLLAEHGARVDATDDEGWTPLHWAVFLQESPLAEMLVAKGASPRSRNRDGLSPLDLAMRLGPHDLVDLLGGPPRTGPKPRRNLWHELARHGRYDEILAVVGHDPGLLREKDGFQATLAYTAYRNHHARLGNYLAIHGSEVNEKGPLGQRLIHAIVLADDVGALKRLVSQCEPDLDAADDRGMTALHWAARLRHPQAIALLMAAGANPSRLDSRDRTPLDLAKQCGMRELIRELERRRSSP